MEPSCPRENDANVVQQQQQQLLLLLPVQPSLPAKLAKALKLRRNLADLRWMLQRCLTPCNGRTSSSSALNVSISSHLYILHSHFCVGPADLDHTADVQLHGCKRKSSRCSVSSHPARLRCAGGGSFHAALEQVSLAMFGYMTDLDKVQPQASLDCIVSASAKDLLGLVFHLLDELLFKFATDDFIPCDLQVLFLHVPCDAGACYAAPGCEGLATAHQHAALPQSGAGEYRIAIACRGDRFDLSKHPQGTEIKAITYSNMQVHGVRHGTATHTAEEGSGNVTEAAQAGADVAGLAHDEGVHVYVIVDI